MRRDDGLAAARIRPRLAALAAREGLILGIEDIGRLLKPESKFEAAAELIRNSIIRGQVACVGTVAPQSYKAMKTAHDSFTQALNGLSVSEMSAGECQAVAELWASAIARYHGVEFADGTIECAVKLAIEVIPEGVLPAKAIDLLENAAVFKKVSMLSSESKDAPPSSLTVSISDFTEVIREQYGIELKWP